MRILAGLCLAALLTACAPPRPTVLSVEDAAHARLGVQTGTTGELLAHKTFPQADIKHFDDIIDAIGALKAGQLDAVMTGYPAALQAAKRNKDLILIKGNLSDEDTSIGVRKGNSILLQQVNDILTDLIADGTIADMQRRWFKTDNQPYEEIEIPERNSGPVLRVGLSATREPFTFVNGGGMITGHDGELARRIAQRLGRPIEFQNMRLTALIPAIQTGKIDLIVTGMSATPERAKKIDFTQRYYVLHNVLLAKAPQDGFSNSAHWLTRIQDSFEANLIKEKRYLMLIEGLKTTTLVTLLSALFGTALGAVICALRISDLLWLQYPARGFIAVLRGTPVLVVLMLIFYVAFASVNVSPIVASVFAFSLNFGAYTAEIFRAGLGALDRGQTEAGLALGLTRRGVFCAITLPQLIQRVLPVYTGEMISLVKMTSIVGYIAVNDLTKAGDIIRSRTFDAFFPLVTVAVLYFLLAAIFIEMLTVLERRLNHAQSTD